MLPAAATIFLLVSSGRQQRSSKRASPWNSVLIALAESNDRGRALTHVPQLLYVACELKQSMLLRQGDKSDSQIKSFPHALYQQVMKIGTPFSTKSCPFFSCAAILFLGIDHLGQLLASSCHHSSHAPCGHHHLSPGV